MCQNIFRVLQSLNKKFIICLFQRTHDDKGLLVQCYNSFRSDTHSTELTLHMAEKRTAKNKNIDFKLTQQLLIYPISRIISHKL